MKKIFLFIAVCIFYTSFTVGQNQLNSFKLPAKVKAAFQNDFSGARVYNVVPFRKNKKLYYRIETIVKRKINKITFNKNGEIVIVEKEIAINKVPEKIIKKLKKDYSGTEIMVAHKVISDKRVSYELDTTQGTEEYTVRISDKGKILKRTHIFQKVEEGC